MSLIKPFRVKRFGQHFLHQKSCLKRIIQETNIQISDCFIEIGPGGGALTEYLLPQIRQLIAIEIDVELCDALRKKFSNETQKFSLYCSDALQMNFDVLQYPVNTRVRMIGNLPYNVATPILFHLLNYRHIIYDFHIMLQKEVANRLVAHQGEKAYSRFSVIIQYYCKVKRLFVVSAGAFLPPPRVESAFVRLEPWNNPPLKARDELLLKYVVKLAFHQKRKVISNSLKTLFTSSELEQCHVDPKARAQQLSVLDYVKLSNYLHARYGKEKKQSL